VGAVDDEGDPVGAENQSAEIAMILKVLETRIKNIEEAVARQVAQGAVAFDDLRSTLRPARKSTSATTMVTHRWCRFRGWRPIDLVRQQLSGRYHRCHPRGAG